MAKLQLLVRLAPGTEPKWYLAENPAWIEPRADQAGDGGWLVALTPPLAADQAYFHWQEVDKRAKLAAGLWAILPQPSLFAWAVSKALRLRFPGHPRRLVPEGGQHRCLDPQQLRRLVEEIRRLLAGSLVPDYLLEKELRAQGWWPADIRQALNWGLSQKLFAAMPGMVRQPWGELRCSRCRALISELRPCVKCGRIQCPACPECAAIGEIRGCGLLWFMESGGLHEAEVSANQHGTAMLQLDLELTPAQARASRELVEFLDSGETRILVWAACGAGKTEVAFAAIEAALSKGMQVLFAIPRRSVVRDLAGRLAKVFPGVKTAVHYGGRPWRQEGPLVLATTHQTLRFHRRFGLVVLDEVDAYPYHGSEMLRLGVERSLAEGGKLIEMTATPHHIGSKTRIITIPARYHGSPLPEPRMLKLPLPPFDELADKGLPRKISGIIEANPRPWLVFAPTVAAVRLIADHLEHTLRRRVCGSWAGDPRRDQKTDRFAEGGYEVMVATSIMERGVTLANVQVMVLYCDHVIFDANSLIQMAGRVGRKAEHPTGEVWFVGARITEAMREALERIRYLNRQARKLGLLKEDRSV